MLRAVAADVRLDVVRVLLAIDQVLRIIRVRDVADVNALPEDLPAGAERGIVVERQALDVAAEQLREPAEKMIERLAHVPADQPRALEELIWPHFSELAENDAAADFERDMRAQ